MAIESLRSHLDGFYDDAVFGAAGRRPWRPGWSRPATRRQWSTWPAASCSTPATSPPTSGLATCRRSCGAFESAAEGFAAVGDERGRGEAVLWQGLYHQVVRSDSLAALPYLESARDVASDQRDDLTLSYAERHLGFHAWEAGRDADARPTPLAFGRAAPRPRLAGRDRRRAPRAGRVRRDPRRARHGCPAPR